MEEKELFEEGEIKVTSHNIFIGKRSYAIANIKSVSMAEKVSPWVALLMMLLIMGGFSFIGFAGFFGFLAVGFSGELDALIDQEIILPLAIGILLIVGAIILKILSPYSSYVIRLSYLSAIANIFHSKDKEFVQKIIDVINSAVESSASQ